MFVLLLMLVLFASLNHRLFRVMLLVLYKYEEYI